GGAAHGGEDVVAPRVAGRALVEGHGDVGAQGRLDLDRPLGSDAVGGPVDVRAGGDAVVVDLDVVALREDLEASGIGQDRAITADHLVQAAVGGDDLEAGAQVEMVGVAEDDVRVERRRGELADGQALDGAGGADGHEDGRLDGPARGLEDAGAGV